VALDVGVDLKVRVIDIHMGNVGLLAQDLQILWQVTTKIRVQRQKFKDLNVGLIQFVFLLRGQTGSSLDDDVVRVSCIASHGERGAFWCCSRS
jgi:hypothetical protein